VPELQGVQGRDRGVSRVDSLVDLLVREKTADVAHVHELIGVVLTEEARQHVDVPWPQVLQIVDETIRLEAIIDAVTALILVDRATLPAVTGGAS
jgi:hypothetical protein